MGYAIHCRVRDNKKVYRIWSTFTDKYITAENENLEQLRRWLRKDALQTAAQAFDQNWPFRVECAETRGTSGLGTHELTGPWEKNIDERE